MKAKKRPRDDEADRKIDLNLSRGEEPIVHRDWIDQIMYCMAGTNRVIMQDFRS